MRFVDVVSLGFLCILAFLSGFFASKYFVYPVIAISSGVAARSMVVSEAVRVVYYSAYSGLHEALPWLCAVGSVYVCYSIAVRRDTGVLRLATLFASRQRVVSIVVGGSPIAAFLSSVLGLCTALSIHFSSLIALYPLSLPLSVAMLGPAYLVYSVSALLSTVVRRPFAALALALATSFAIATAIKALGVPPGPAEVPRSVFQAALADVGVLAVGAGVSVMSIAYARGFMGV